MSNHLERARAIVRGAVQGVGFRAFVDRLAKELNLAGWTSNSPQGVLIEVEGAGTALRQFLVRIEREKPPQAIIQSLEFSFLDATGAKDFVIRDSETSGPKTDHVLPDIATCPHCVMEIFSPAIAATATPLRTAPIAARGSPSSRTCPTTGPRPR